MLTWPYKQLLFGRVFHRAGCACFSRQNAGNIGWRERERDRERGRQGEGTETDRWYGPRVPRPHAERKSGASSAVLKAGFWGSGFKKEGCYTTVAASA